MDRLFSALVLGIYLASCAPALPPAGSAADGRTDGRGAGRASSAGRSAAAKSVLPDLAREERLVRAWQSKAGTWNAALERALQEQIPEMRCLYDELRPAPGFDPKSVWGDTAPHTYVYQVSRGNVIVPEGEHKGQSFYDVRQVGFLFSKVEERERTNTAYISKAELLAPYFALCFGEKAMQRQAGNLDPDYSLYPLVKLILDKGLKPADYTGYEAYYDLYKEERMEKRKGVSSDYYDHEDVYLKEKYSNEITVEHREYLKQYDLYAADMKSPLEPGETQLHREFIAGQGINFASPAFTARLNSFSLRKNAYENVGDVIDGYWEALADSGSGAFGRAFRRAVENLDAYLAARNVDTGVNLPTYFKIRHNISVYHCYAPRLAVCGAAQALSLGWLQVPVVAVELNAGNACWLDVPRITSADSNKLGISYASFETGRGNGQDGFSGYGVGHTKQAPHALNGKPGEWRPDKFSMGSFSSLYYYRSFNCDSNGYPVNRFAEAYLQCNYPYKLFSRAALKGMTQVEAARVMTKTCGDSIPEYWLNVFHGEKDERITTGTIIRAVIIILIVILIAVLTYNIQQAYQAYLLAQAIEAAGVETAEATGAALEEIMLSAELGPSGVPWNLGSSSGSEVASEVGSSSGSEAALSSSSSSFWEGPTLPGGIVYLGKAESLAVMPTGYAEWTVIVSDGNAYFVPNWILKGAGATEWVTNQFGIPVTAVVHGIHSSAILTIPIIAGPAISGVAMAPQIAAVWIDEMLAPILPLVFTV